MENRDQLKQQFINSATINSKALAEGDYKIANKHAKILLKIFRRFEEGNEDKQILVELLTHEYIGVRMLAAIDLLRLQYATSEAVRSLEIIALMDETGKTTAEKLKIMVANIQLKSWNEKGYVT